MSEKRDSLLSTIICYMMVSEKNNLSNEEILNNFIVDCICSDPDYTIDMIYGINVYTENFNLKKIDIDKIKELYDMKMHPENYKKKINASVSISRQDTVSESGDMVIDINGLSEENFDKLKKDISDLVDDAARRIIDDNRSCDSKSEEKSNDVEDEESKRLNEICNILDSFHMICDMHHHSYPFIHNIVFYSNANKELYRIDLNRNFDKTVYRDAKMAYINIGRICPEFLKIEVNKARIEYNPDVYKYQRYLHDVGLFTVHGQEVLR